MIAFIFVIIFIGMGVSILNSICSIGNSAVNIAKNNIDAQIRQANIDNAIRERELLDKKEKILNEESRARKAIITPIKNPMIITCPNCKKMLKVEDAPNGSFKISCPHCKRHLEIL